ncbi:YrhC family protein [Oceanobacillus manasiensis]|uniref:YrhC family protein n=1 Tax=Oceanobacillus manasiensis TaxID=586413 RepID=UPI0005A71A51|nr:YrhC family protein [Oceanobacillus manasiensis]
MDKQKKLELKSKDYHRFIAVLLILSSYLYMGAIINTYMKPSGNGDLLFVLSLGGIATGIILAIKQLNIKKEIENER